MEQLTDIGCSNKTTGQLVLIEYSRQGRGKNNSALYNNFKFGKTEPKFAFYIVIKTEMINPVRSRLYSGQFNNDSYDENTGEVN
ncbi:eukaryotic translation initiation factor 3 subunit I-like [Gossypium australe]|uniref:Eukaryotic translation initiation factor 3 subunit I-like n=1 Tax=Gossypium australe TaxID=47621 RepID=A0A5B6X9A2_9ROSI|nr:eukaryotic translation initiation factor 3 subunit I-like [Gossypium australe]